MIALIIILGIIIIVLGYTTYNLLVKNEKLEDISTRQEEFVSGLSIIIKQSSDKLKEIDSKGSFEADDEVGWFFKEVKLIDSMLNQFIIENGEENKEEKGT